MSCALCNSAHNHGWWGVPGSHCSKCHRSWRGLKEIHCNKCCRHFSTQANLDLHDTPKGCLDDVALIKRGLHLSEKSVWARNNPKGVFLSPLNTKAAQ